MWECGPRSARRLTHAQTKRPETVNRNEERDRDEERKRKRDEKEREYRVEAVERLRNERDRKRRREKKTERRDLPAESICFRKVKSSVLRRVS